MIFESCLVRFLADMPIGSDELCPLGFAPHSLRPTKCKRCFRDYSDHKKKKLSESNPSLNQTSESSSSRLGSKPPIGRSRSPDDRYSSDSETYHNPNVAALGRSRNLDSKGSSTVGFARSQSLAENLDSSHNNDSTTGGYEPFRRRRQRSMEDETETETPIRRSVDFSDSERARSPRRLQVLGAREIPIQKTDSPSPDVQFILQVKTAAQKPPHSDSGSSSDPDDMELESASVAPTEATTMQYHDCIEDMQTMVNTLKKELDDMSEKCKNLESDKEKLLLHQQQLEKEKDRLQQNASRSQHTSMVERRKSSSHEAELKAAADKAEKATAEASKFKTKVHELESISENIKEENNKLKRKLKDMENEMEKKKSKSESHKTLVDLEKKLKEANASCERLQTENNRYKEDIRSMETEMDEMQDSFREDQADEFRDLKKELEQASKNCRIMQFKLRKTERSRDQLELDRNQAEEKLKQILSLGNFDIEKAEKLRQLELELNNAREVSIHLHAELESTQKKLKQLESDKGTGNKAPPPPTTPTPTMNGRTSSRPQLLPRPRSVDSSSPSRGDETAQLLRDLYDTMEREKDLKEQFKFSEEEANSLRKKLSSVEEENESLLLQVKKMAAGGKTSGGGRSGGRSPTPGSRPSSRTGRDKHTSAKENSEGDSGISDEFEELSPSELKLQLELNEQELVVLRKKLSERESENEHLKREVKNITEKLQEVKEAQKHSDLPPKPEKANAYYEQRLKLMEEEAKELRRKLIEAERENERLSEELNVKPSQFVSSRRGSKAIPTMQRSRSLDSDQQVDVKRQLTLVEQEASILRQKLIELENENDKLCTSNKTLSLRVSKKGPPSNTEQIAIENISLKDEVNRLEKKLAVVTGSNADLRSLGASDLLGTGGRSPSILSVASISSLASETTAATAAKVAEEQLFKVREELKHRDEDYRELTARLEKLQEENEQAEISMRRIKEKANYKDRPPRKVSDACTRSELKKFVEELDQEVRNLLQALLQLEKEKAQLKQQVARLGDEPQQSKNNEAEMQLLMEKHNNEVRMLNDRNNQLTVLLEQESRRVKAADEESRKLKTEVEITEKDRFKREEELKKIKKEKENLEKEISRNEEELKKVRKEKETLEKEKAKVPVVNIKKLESDLKFAKDDLEKLKSELDSEKRKANELQTKLNSGELVAATDLAKAKDDFRDAKAKQGELEKKLISSEKKTAELELAAKEALKEKRRLEKKVEDSKKELEAEKWKMKAAEGQQKELTMGWLKERDDLKKQLGEAQKKHDEIQRKLQDMEKEWKVKEDTLKEELTSKRTETTAASNASKEELQKKDKEVKSLKDQNNKLKSKLEELEDKLKKVEENYKESQEKYKKVNTSQDKDKEAWENREMELQAHIKADAKKIARMEKEHEADLRDRDEDMLKLKDKLKKTEAEVKRLMEEQGDDATSTREKMRTLEKDLAQEKQEYDDLTTKYEMLEEDYVVIKAQLVMEKEKIENEYTALRRENNQVESELKSLRETFNIRQDTWIKEKLDMQEKIKELLGKLARTNAQAWDTEKTRLKESIEEKTSLLEQMKKDHKAVQDELDRLRRQVEDQRKMLEDWEKLKNYGRTSAEEMAAQQEQIQDLKSRKQQAEKTYRTELSSLKMKLDQHAAQHQDEMQMMKQNAAKYRRERDTFKHMLEGAQKTIAELRTNVKKSSRENIASLGDEKSQVDSVSKQRDELQDKLDDTERMMSKQTTEHMSERAVWEMKMAEMQTKINELEEATILSGGKSRLFGVKTKLELAWQKEREEQHRLLSESHKMATELRQRLVDVEASRERERRDAKRQLDELRHVMNSEQGDTQKRIQELQGDLVDLRDALAKMRAANERVKRDRDRFEREREDLRLILTDIVQAQTEDRATLVGLMDEASKLQSLVPTILGEKTTRPSYNKTESKNAEQMRDEFKAALQRITAATEELKKAQGLREEEKIKKYLVSKKSATDSDDSGVGSTSSRPPRAPGLGAAGRSDSASSASDTPLSRWQNPQRVTNYPASPPSMVISPPSKMRSAGNAVPSKSLFRKSLSLDHNLTIEEMLNQKIWKSEESCAGSTSSLPSQERGSSTGRSFPSNSLGTGAASVSQSASTLPRPPIPSPRTKKSSRRRAAYDSDIGSEPSSAGGSRETSVERERQSQTSLASTSEVSAPLLSTASERLSHTPHKSTGGVKDRLKSFTKSKSVEGSAIGDEIARVGVKAMSPGLGSSSENVEASQRGKEKEGKGIKSKISNLFRRTPSRERSIDKSDADVNKPLPAAPPMAQTTAKPPPMPKGSGAKPRSESGRGRHRKPPSSQVSATAKRFLSSKVPVTSMSVDEPTWRGPYD